MYLIIGAYLIASAVKSSGLGERIAYWFILRFVKGYRSIIVSVFFLTFILSLIIPHPWPRAFLIMSVMHVLIKNAGICKEDAINIGFSVFSVFAASVPVSLIFLTGDSVINALAVQNSGESLGWGGWFLIMGIPAITTSVITCILFLGIFKPVGQVNLNHQEIRAKLDEMGKLSEKEVRVLVWLLIAVTLWMTDALHGIHIGWVTLVIAVLMSFPVIGGVLTDRSWSQVPVQVLIFITAAMAIGKVGEVTGMNSWIAQTILPSSMPQNIILLAAFIALVSIILHMLLGSVIAVMGVAIPALLSFTQPMGINPLVTSLLVYTAICTHYLLPFQHLNILVGLEEENGGYTQKQTLRLGAPLTLVVFAVILLVELPWWKAIGLI